jgi:hypothetical protein
MHPALAGRPVYLDYNANTPIDRRVVDALLPAMTEDSGNPSSVHVFAEAPRPAARSGTRAGGRPDRRRRGSRHVGDGCGHRASIGCLCGTTMTPRWPRHIAPRPTGGTIPGKGHK